ncbi:hypothetical protein C8J56DRAFT_490721 [Mycena floridula]|nr:hypothetical protein C8J56DRAFT_490721 [Mycena floridula]
MDFSRIVPSSSSPASSTKTRASRHKPSKSLVLLTNIMSSTPSTMSSTIGANSPLLESQADLDSMSRSELLLRSTLLKDTRPAAHLTHRRRHSHVPASIEAPNLELSKASMAGEEARGSTLFRSSSGAAVRRAASPRSPYYTGDAEFNSTSRLRSPSPSPSAGSSSSSSVFMTTPTKTARMTANQPRMLPKTLSSQSIASAPSSPRHLTQRSPSYQNHQQHSSLVSPVPLTPHEQVLRARLERVLSDSDQRSEAQTTKERKRSSMSANGTTGVFGWLWRENDATAPSSRPTTPPPRPQSRMTPGPSSPLSPSRSQTPQPHSDTPRGTPTRKSASLSASVPHFAHSHPPLQRQAWSVDSVPKAQLALHMDILDVEEDEENEPLTPPLTPPSMHQPLSRMPMKKRGLSEDQVPRYPSALQKHSKSNVEEQELSESPVEMQLSTPPSSSSSPPRSPSHRHLSHQSLSSPRTPRGPFDSEGLVTSPVSLLTSPNQAFDARHASQQCKLIDGYVSFASVEGLGEPPASAHPTNASASSLLDGLDLADSTKKPVWSRWLSW